MGPGTKAHHAVRDEVLRVAHGASDHPAPYRTAGHCVRHQYAVSLGMIPGTAKEFGQLDEHGNREADQCADSRISSMVTPSGRVTAKTTACATSSGRSMADRGGSPGTAVGSTPSHSDVSVAAGHTSVVVTPVPRSSSVEMSC